MTVANYIVTYQVTQVVSLEAESAEQAIRIVEQMDDAERAAFVHSQTSEIIAVHRNSSY